MSPYRHKALTDVDDEDTRVNGRESDSDGLCRAVLRLDKTKAVSNDFW